MRAMYPGSFDPVHLGHLDVMERAAHLFSEVGVIVFTNAKKSSLFSANERLALLATAVSHLPNVKVYAADGLAVQFAKDHGFAVMIRGLRAVLDYDYEMQMALTNRQLEPHVETLFFLTSQQHAHLSSSLIKELASHGASLKGFVPPPVEIALRQKYRSGGSANP